MKKRLLIVLAALTSASTWSQTLDQSNFGSNSSGWQVNNAAYTALGQGFQAGISGQLTSVHIDLDNTNPVYPPIAGNTTLTIYSGLGFGGTALGSVVFSTNGSENGEFAIDLSSANINVVAGNSYTYKLSNCTGRLSMINATSNVYANGDIYYTINNGAQSTYGGDLKFKTYVTLPPPGKNLSFDGNNDMVNLGTGITNTINTAQSFTVEAWFNQAVPTGANNMCIVGNHENNTHVDLRIENDQLKAFIGFGAISVTAPGTLSLNTWYHAAVTLDAQTLSLYLDGVLVASTPRGGFVLPSSSTGYRIGADYFAGRMNGQIDEVRIFNSAMTPEFIARTMNCEIDPSTNGLIAYYKLNQGIAAANNAAITSATDATSNAYHGTLSGFALNGSTSNWVGGSPVVSDDVIPAAPTATLNYTYCLNETAASLTATGTNVNWFTTANGGVGSTTAPVPSTTTAGNTSYWAASTNASGCESERIEIVVSVLAPATGTDVQTACGSFTWIDGNTYNSSNNSATYVISNGAANGCDSIVTLDLVVNQSTTSTDIQTACGSFTWMDGNTYTASNNTATFVLNGANQNGCDSIITLDLTILPLPVVNVTDNGDLTLTASTASSYQWIDCSTGTLIAGETAQTYTATSNGTYAVIATSADGCSDTSNCVLIDYLNANISTIMNVSIAPNPSSDKISIAFNAKEASLVICDVNGKQVASSVIQNGQIVSISDLDAGVYFMTLNTTIGSVTKRVVKQ